MRKPTEVERLYLDFDGFFASVEQQARPRLRGKPVGVVPFDVGPGARTCMIACSREAKLRGVNNVMGIQDALALCPELIIVPQSPDLYRRAHNALLSEIEAVLPVDAVKSIDELTCRIETAHRSAPEVLGRRIKDRLREQIGPWITCSIGMAANRQLAKMACKAGKRTQPARYGDGLMVWRPADMPGPLLDIPLPDVPGIGRHMARRLAGAGIITVGHMLETQPKQLRALWGNVTGERLWYALHGHDVQTPPSGRGMYGHSRVLPPSHRTLEAAQEASLLLVVKAARRMRRDGRAASRLSLWLSLRGSGWGAETRLHEAHDDLSVREALQGLWLQARSALRRRETVFRLSVTLFELTPLGEQQMDLLSTPHERAARTRREAATAAVDALNARYGQTLVHVGTWSPPPGGYAGGKISYTRIPSAEDFW